MQAQQPVPGIMHNLDVPEAQLPCACMRACLPACLKLPSLTAFRPCR